MVLEVVIKDTGSLSSVSLILLKKAKLVGRGSGFCVSEQGVTFYHSLLDRDYQGLLERDRICLSTWGKSGLPKRVVVGALTGKRERKWTVLTSKWRGVIWTRNILKPTSQGARVTILCVSTPIRKR